MWYIDDGFLFWIIPSMYLSHKAVNWVVPLVLSHLLSLGFSLNLWFYYYYYYYIIYAYILAYHLCSISLVSYSYHIIQCMFPAWYYLLSLCLLLHACAHDMIFNTCFFNSNLSVYVCLSQHATWHSPHHSLGSFWLPWICMSKFRSLKLVSRWSEMHNGSVNHRQTV